MMTFLRIVISLYLLFEHDLRANAFRVCREGKPVFTLLSGRRVGKFRV